MWFRLIFTFETELGTFTTDLLSPIWLSHFPGLVIAAYSYILCSFKIIKYRGLFFCKGKLGARLRSQNGLGLKQLLLCQESCAWFSPSRNPPTLSGYSLASCLFTLALSMPQAALSHASHPLLERAQPRRPQHPRTSPDKPLPQGSSTSNLLQTLSFWRLVGGDL